MSRLRPRLSYANVMSTLAVFAVLGGGAVAAITIPDDSVGTRQLKKNAVVSKKVRDRSLLATDFKAGQLPSGGRGPAGPPGAQGQPGAKGDTGAPGARGESAFDPIPSGKTVIGAANFDLSEPANTASDFFFTIHLPGVAPVELTGANVNFAPSAFDAQTSDEDPACTGTIPAPTAPPGKVCLYLGSLSDGTDANSLTGTTLPGEAGKRVFGVAWTDGADADSDAFMNAVWAYTAP